jgi:hypothetical protein
MGWMACLMKYIFNLLSLAKESVDGEMHRSNRTVGGSKVRLMHS